jgi:hypothetical protein
VSHPYRWWVLSLVVTAVGLTCLWAGISAAVRHDERR